MTVPLDPNDEALIERAAAALRTPVALAPDFEARVMASVRAMPRPRRRRLGWWLERQTVMLHVRPIWGLAAAAVLGALILVPGGAAPSPGPNEVVISFVAPFPEATSVAVAGSFTGWRPVPLRREGGEGVFLGRVVVEAGVHEYMFVVDGDRWVADPLAESYVEDGFGRMNSVLVARRGT